MAVTTRGKAFIASHEAIYLYTYKDPVGILTDGVGNTDAAGIRAPKSGGRISLQQALAEFAINLQKYNDRVHRAIRSEMTSDHENALTSFDLNTGAIISGTVDNKLNAGDVTAAMATLRKYVHGGGKVLGGLVRRRREEALIFTDGIYPDHAILIKDSPMSAGRRVNPSAINWSDEPVKFDIEPNIEVPPMPTRKPTPKGNFVIDLLLRPIWRFIEGFL